ncbi:MAG TPA: hypothetical protein VEQ37_18230 [Actinomycetota bacterium]|nr:hypothetical protein [Actinomycetota bacterium]
MTSRETLECRIYMAEDAMYRRGDELDRRLHELESRLKDLTAAVHRVLCQTGGTPLEAKAGTIVKSVEVFEAGIALSEIRGLAERVTSLKRLVDDYEREFAESAEVPRASSPDRPVLEALAASV